MLSRILDNLYIGDWQDAKRTDHSEFVCVTVAFDAPFKGEHLFGMVDGRVGDNNADNIYEMSLAIPKVIELMQGPKKVLVHCVAGRSRSAAVIVGVLMVLKGLTLEDALLFLWERHPEADPRMSLLEGFIKERTRRSFSG